MPFWTLYFFSLSPGKCLGGWIFPFFVLHHDCFGCSLRSQGCLLCESLTSIVGLIIEQVHDFDCIQLSGKWAAFCGWILFVMHVLLVRKAPHYVGHMLQFARCWYFWRGWGDCWAGLFVNGLQRDGCWKHVSRHLDKASRVSMLPGSQVAPHLAKDACVVSCTSGLVHFFFFKASMIIYACEYSAGPPSRLFDCVHSNCLHHFFLASTAGAPAVTKRLSLSLKERFGASCLG